MQITATIRGLRLLAFASATAAVTAAAATDIPQLPQGARLAATCVACHGTNGATQGTTIPALAGQPRQTLADSLRAFKTNARQSTIMTQIARGYSDEQIEQLAAYFSAQKK